MKIIDKYLTNTAISYFLLVMLFLLGMQIFIEFTIEFPKIGIGNYSFHRALIYILLMLPHDLYRFFPVASLLGSIIGLGLLASHSELIIIRASGVSIIRVCATLIKIGVPLISLMLLLGEAISPMALSRAEKIKLEAISAGKAAMTEQGVWVCNNKDIVNIGEISGKNIINITRYKISNDFSLKSITNIDRGIYDHQNQKWTFKKLRGTKFNRSSTQSFHTNDEVSSIKFSPQFININSLNSDHKDLYSLYLYTKQLTQSGLDSSNHLFAFWQRIFAPMETLIMILLAIPFVFGSLRSSPMGFKILMGIAMGFAFYMFNQFVGPLAIVYKLHPFLAALLPSLVFSLVGVTMLVKAR